MQYVVYLLNIVFIIFFIILMTFRNVLMKGIFYYLHFYETFVDVEF